MKRTIILAAASIAVLTATSALAADISRHELRHDRAELARQQQDLRDAQTYGSRHDVRKQREDVRDARRELREDRRDAYRAGMYVRPQGYRARSWAAGDRLPSSYYGQRYQVEPSRYGLASANGGERWVRVDRDVVRVSRDGTVREVRQGWFR